MNRRELLVGTTTLVASTISSIPAQSAGSSSAPLRRGVNLSHWFAQSFEGYSLAHYESFVGAHRLSDLARRGFDHVRVPLDPALLFLDEPSVGLRTRFISFLTNVVRLAHFNGLAVVLDLHPVEPTTKAKLLQPDGSAAFVRNWRLLAADIDQAQLAVYLEILNEPAPIAGGIWWALQQSAIEAIRDANKTVPIIANGGSWSGIDDLIARRPYADLNIIYTIHYYNPILFTQQSGTWGWAVAERVASLDWPIEVKQAATAAREATRDDEAMGFVRDAIAGGSFSLQTMIHEFERLSVWQRTNGHPPIYVGEFGVIAMRTPPAARIRWLRAAREQFELRGWGWALWDLSPTFGLLRTRPNERVGAWDDMQLDDETLDALGIAS